MSETAREPQAVAGVAGGRGIPGAGAPRWRAALGGLWILGLVLPYALGADGGPPPQSASASSGEVLGKTFGGVWQAQGPGPNTFGQVENIVPDDEVVGAIHTVAAHPVHQTILYVGAVNGGIWKTTTATATSPVWVQQADQEASLSIGALEFDPFDPNNWTLVAGIGRFSSFAQFGGELTGLLRTTNGLTWTALDGGGTLVGQNISGVAPRGATIVVSVNTGVAGPGIWRSTNTGATFTKISGAAGTGLPSGTTFDLVGDRLNPARLFTGIPGQGVYRSDDTGATWSRVSDAALDTALDGDIRNVELAVGRHDNVYVAIAVAASIPSSSQSELGFVFRSGDAGATWTEMDLPEIAGSGIHPGNQAHLHLSIVADPTNADIVYLGGDRQNPSAAIGAADFSGRLVRGDASQPSGSQWVHLTHRSDLGPPGGGTASSSAPHADSREMAFDAAGNLIETDDGGIYKRTSPRDNTGDWFSINGNIQTTEFHNTAYDENADVVIGGAQDTGTPQQLLPGQRRWLALLNADGGDVAAAATGAGLSVRYASIQFLGNFRRMIWDAGNNLLLTEAPTLIPLAGSPGVLRQFVTPLKINNVDPQRLVLGGGNGVFESFDQGDTVALVDPPGLTVGSFFGIDGDPIAYGSLSNPDVLYVGVGHEVHVRTLAPPAPLVQSLSFPGTTTVTDVAVALDNPSAAVAVTFDAVYRTANAGASWSNVTGNLFSLAQTELRAVAYLRGVVEDALAVGAQNGVFIAFESSGFTFWQQLGTSLPTVPVQDLDYDGGDNVLVAGTLGRGAWKLSNLLPQDQAPPIASFTVDCTLLSCEFDASASSDDFGIESYSWSFGDGTTGSGVMPTHNYAQPGKYTVTLTVTDFAGKTDTDVDLAIADGAPPSASFTVACTLLGCTFDAAASSDDLEIVSYSWDFGDGTFGSGVAPSHTYALPGKYTVTLTVTDCADKTDTDVDTAVADAAPPVAVIIAGCNLLSCQFDCSASSDDIEVVSCEWDFGDGTAPVVGVAPVHTYAVPGKYDVTLTVVDCAGKSDTETVVAIADAAPPVADFTVDCDLLSCQFDASGSSDDLEIVSYAWDFGDGTTGSGVTPSHTYAEPGTYDVTLTVTDCAGKTGSHSEPLTPDQAPTACFVLSCSNLTCSLDASCSSDDFGIVSYSWDFGDGTTGTGQVVSHGFFHDGEHTITLTVSDGSGQSASTAQTTTVVDEEAFLILHVLCH